ncbi:MBL fold metallo-hydrolase [Candidatus Bathyarchaeota archaeon]|nr:MBL fold metallo-hydrolase [Candidatus Bathyarchaeota archaeon]
MKKIKLLPIAFESFGVRSMCTFVETPDLKILLDPGISLGPRFALLPHPLEYEARKKCRDRLREFAKKAEIITISHYHNDHYTPNYVENVWIGSSPEEAENVYKDKIVLMKDIKSSINFNQRRRGWMIQKLIKRIAKNSMSADGKDLEFGKTKIKFSRPVFHGIENSQLGWVLMLTIYADDEKLLYASDVQGPMVKDTLELILDDDPCVLIIGGPPFYLLDFRVKSEDVGVAIENLKKIVKKIPTTILEHHSLRSENWREFIHPVFEVAKKSNNEVLTGAEFIGEANSLLEFKRRELYKTNPPSEDFLKWTKLPSEARRKTPPPIDL